MSEWQEQHLEIVSTMIRSGVAQSKHVQKQTLKGWCGGFEGDILDDAIEDLIAVGLIREKGRGTITLRSIQAGERFIEQHDENGDYTIGWK